MNPPAPLQIDTFLPYMRDVIRCEQSLHELNLMWRMIEASAKMNCPLEAKAILPTMAATRAGFNRLEQELVSSLVREKVATVLSEIGTKAQYVIDIVVRNLYERTADVGFLATDNELCAFVAGLQENQNRVRARLRAYRSKYTVYDEIILLDAAGNVLVQIDETTPLEGSTDALIAQTLASDSYVETFRASDLRPGKQQALIYSRRMLHPDSGAVVGVLCLCFNFEQEMAGEALTNKAAEEMRWRINAPKVFVGTFHALGLLIIRENSEKIGVNKKMPLSREKSRMLNPLGKSSSLKNRVNFFLFASSVIFWSLVFVCFNFVSSICFTPTKLPLSLFQSPKFT